MARVVVFFNRSDARIRPVVVTRRAANLMGVGIVSV